MSSTTAQRSELHLTREAAATAGDATEDTTLDPLYSHTSTQYHLGIPLTDIAERTQRKRP